MYDHDPYESENIPESTASTDSYETRVLNLALGGTNHPSTHIFFPSERMLEMAATGDFSELRDNEREVLWAEASNRFEDHLMDETWQIGNRCNDIYGETGQPPVIIELGSGNGPLLRKYREYQKAGTPINVICVELSPDNAEAFQSNFQTTFQSDGSTFELQHIIGADSIRHFKDDLINEEGGYTLISETKAEDALALFSELGITGDIFILNESIMHMDRQGLLQELIPATASAEKGYSIHGTDIGFENERVNFFANKAPKLKRNHVSLASQTIYDGIGFETYDLTEEYEKTAIVVEAYLKWIADQVETGNFASLPEKWLETIDEGVTPEKLRGMADEWAFTRDPLMKIPDWLKRFIPEGIKAELGQMPYYSFQKTVPPVSYVA